MKKLTIMLIPDGTSKVMRQIQFPSLLLKLAIVSGLALATVSGYIFLDYIQLRSIRTEYQSLMTESEGLKGEARILMDSLEDVKTSLRRVQDYSSKLGEITSLKLKSVSQKTGIGPLTKEEEIKSAHAVLPTFGATEEKVPIGIKIDKLVFKPVFHKLTSIGENASRNAFELKQLLSQLSQQKSLLASIPMTKPVPSGWITSSFGTRISPFTGEKTPHHGLDIAAPVGTPIYAPADGTVIFSGAKAGFGNFVMIAHGYGVVTRYGHNHQNLVQPGQRVRRGEQIGTVGSSGRVTGPHLHYEIQVNGHLENPKKFILDDGLVH